MHHTIDWLTLALTPGLGPRGCRLLLARFGTVQDILAASADQLRRVPGLRRDTAEGLAGGWARERAAREQARADGLGVRILSRDHPAYPPLLKEIPDPPLVLYLLGEPALLSKPAVAVVGARAATRYGREMAGRVAAGLAGNGLVVVSGLALGIDTAAHQGALEAGGATVAVLGCGLDTIYPPQNRNLFQAIADSGAVLSEYPLGTRPEPFRFPARNRIISGLSRGVVVVEAARRSGSLITATLALEQGREVFAIPGRIDSHKSDGCHRLIQEGAKLVRTIEDIVEELRPAGLLTPPAEPEDAGDAATAGGLTPQEQRLLACLEVYPTDIETLIAASGLPAQTVGGLLVALELKGLVAALPGQHYQRLSEPAKPPAQE